MKNVKPGQREYEMERQVAHFVSGSSFSCQKCRDTSYVQNSCLLIYVYSFYLQCMYKLVLSLFYLTFLSSRVLIINFMTYEDYHFHLDRQPADTDTVVSQNRKKCYASVHVSVTVCFLPKEGAVE